MLKYLERVWGCDKYLKNKSNQTFGQPNKCMIGSDQSGSKTEHVLSAFGEVVQVQTSDV